MRVFAVDTNNDLFIRGNGNMALDENIRAVMQAAQQAAQAQLGEMILAADEGVPNFQTVWTSRTNIAQFEAYVRAAIMSTTGVIEVKDLTAEALENKVVYSATISTIYGSAVISNA